MLSLHAAPRSSKAKTSPSGKRPRTATGRIGLAIAGGGPIGAMYELGALRALDEALDGVDLLIRFLIIRHKSIDFTSYQPSAWRCKGDTTPKQVGIAIHDLAQVIRHDWHGTGTNHHKNNNNKQTDGCIRSVSRSVSQAL